MNIDEICTEMTQKGSFYNNLLVRYFSSSDVPLIISELSLAFLKDRNKMNKIIKEGGMKGYFARSIYFWSTKSNLKMILSGETRISQWATQVEELELEEYRIEDYWEEIEIILNDIKVPFRDATIFSLVYRDQLTYREITNLHGWSPSTISRSIRTTLTKIKEKFKG